MSDREINYLKWRLRCNLKEIELLRQHVTHEQACEAWEKAYQGLEDTDAKDAETGETA